jgi:Protein of unknown function (DUF3107)
VVDVKVGVKGAARELAIDTNAGPEEVTELVREALAGESGLLVLTDDKGRQVLVPVDKLAYIEIGEPGERRVGFGAM